MDKDVSTSESLAEVAATSATKLPPFVDDNSLLEQKEEQEEQDSNNNNHMDTMMLSSPTLTEKTTAIAGEPSSEPQHKQQQQQQGGGGGEQLSSLSSPQEEQAAEEMQDSFPSLTNNVTTDESAIAYSAVGHEAANSKQEYEPGEEATTTRPETTSIVPTVVANDDETESTAAIQQQREEEDTVTSSLQSPAEATTSKPETSTAPSVVVANDEAESAAVVQQQQQHQTATSSQQPAQDTTTELETSTAPSGVENDEAEPTAVVQQQEEEETAATSSQQPAEVTTTELETSTAPSGVGNDEAEPTALVQQEQEEDTAATSSQPPAEITTTELETSTIPFVDGNNETESTAVVQQEDTATSSPEPAEATTTGPETSTSPSVIANDETESAVVVQQQHDTATSSQQPAEATTTEPETSTSPSATANDETESAAVVQQQDTAGARLEQPAEATTTDLETSTAPCGVVNDEAESAAVVQQQDTTATSSHQPAEAATTEPETSTSPSVIANDETESAPVAQQQEETATSSQPAEATTTELETSTAPSGVVNDQAESAAVVQQQQVPSLVVQQEEEEEDTAASLQQPVEATTTEPETSTSPFVVANDETESAVPSLVVQQEEEEDTAASLQQPAEATTTEPETSTSPFVVANNETESAVPSLVVQQQEEEDTAASLQQPAEATTTEPETSTSPFVANNEAESAVPSLVVQQQEEEAAASPQLGTTTEPETQPPTPTADSAAEDLVAKDVVLTVDCETGTADGGVVVGDSVLSNDDEPAAKTQVNGESVRVFYEKEPDVAVESSGDGDAIAKEERAETDDASPSTAGETHAVIPSSEEEAPQPLEPLCAELDTNSTSTGNSETEPSEAATPRQEDADKTVADVVPVNVDGQGNDAVATDRVDQVGNDDTGPSVENHETEQGLPSVEQEGEPSSQPMEAETPQLQQQAREEEALASPVPSPSVEFAEDVGKEDPLGLAGESGTIRSDGVGDAVDSNQGEQAGTQDSSPSVTEREPVVASVEEEVATSQPTEGAVSEPDKNIISTGDSETPQQLEQPEEEAVENSMTTNGESVEGVEEKETDALVAHSTVGGDGASDEQMQDSSPAGTEAEPSVPPVERENAKVEPIEQTLAEADNKNRSAGDGETQPQEAEATAETTSTIPTPREDADKTEAVVADNVDSQSDTIVGTPITESDDVGEKDPVVADAESATVRGDGVADGDAVVSSEGEPAKTEDSSPSGAGAEPASRIVEGEPASGQPTDTKMAETDTNKSTGTSETEQQEQVAPAETSTIPSVQDLEVKDPLVTGQRNVGSEGDALVGSEEEQTKPYEFSTSEAKAEPAVPSVGEQAASAQPTPAEETETSTSTSSTGGGGETPGETTETSVVPTAIIEEGIDKKDAVVAGETGSSNSAAVNTEPVRCPEMADEPTSPFGLKLKPSVNGAKLRGGVDIQKPITKATVIRKPNDVNHLTKDVSLKPAPQIESPVDRTPSGINHLAKDVSLKPAPLIESPVVRTPTGINHLAKDVSLKPAPLMESPVVRTPSGINHLAKDVSLKPAPLMESPVVRTPSGINHLAKDVSLKPAPLIDSPVDRTPSGINHLVKDVNLRPAPQIEATVDHTPSGINHLAKDINLRPTPLSEATVDHVASEALLETSPTSNGEEAVVYVRDSSSLEVEGKHLLMLVSLQSFDGKVVANQQHAISVLDSNGVTYKTLDGANSDNKTRRNDLFELSGMRAKYPQFFIVDGDKTTTFWGDWENFQLANNNGKIKEEFKEAVESPGPIHVEKETVACATPTAAEGGDSVVIQEASSLEMDHLLVLVSLQSFDREVVANQQQTISALDANRVKYQTLDGANADNKTRRNELFELSGIRAKYPQFFIVGSDNTTTFWGDWEKFQLANDNGKIKEEFKEAETSEVESPTPINVEKETVAIATPTFAAGESLIKQETSSLEMDHLLVLVSLQSFDREVVACQQQTISALDANRVKYQTLDGANADNKTRRNELFELSGIRAKYPQFFIVGSDNTTTFWGDWEKFQLANDNGKIKEEFKEAESSDVESPGPIHVEKETAAIATPTFAAGESLIKQETSSLEMDHLLVLVSLQSFDREVVACQQQTISALDANRVKYQTLDGANADNKTRRNELFELSGIRAKYPQFFIVGSDNTTTFWGDWEKFQLANDNGKIKEEFKEAESSDVESPGPNHVEKETVAIATPTTAAEESVVIQDTSSLEIEGKHLLVLVSLQSFEREVVANQQQAIAALDANGVKYKTLDGANADYKTKRNELFDISGIRAKYPQFFTVDRDKTIKFWGDWEKFRTASDSCTIADEFAQALNEISDAEGTHVMENATETLPTDHVTAESGSVIEIAVTAVSDDTQTATDSTPVASSTGEVAALDETCVVAEETQAGPSTVESMEKPTVADEPSKATEETTICNTIVAGETQADANPESPRDADVTPVQTDAIVDACATRDELPIETPGEAVALNDADTEGTASSTVAVAQLPVSDRADAVNEGQLMAESSMVDGENEVAAAASDDETAVGDNALKTESQTADKTAAVKDETPDLAKAPAGGSIEEPAPMEEPSSVPNPHPSDISEQAGAVSPVASGSSSSEVETASAVSETTAKTDSPAADNVKESPLAVGTPAESLEEAAVVDEIAEKPTPVVDKTPTATKTLDGGSSRKPAVSFDDIVEIVDIDETRDVSESNSILIEDTSTRVIEGKHLFVLVSLQSADKEVIANQQQSIATLDSHRVKYKVFDGASPANKSRRNELFFISGAIGKYPQFFIMDGKKSPKFWGDWRKFMKADNKNQIASEFATWEASDSQPSAVPGFDLGKAMAKIGRQVLVLVSLQSSDQDVIVNQKLSTAVLGAKGIDFATFDGSDPSNKTRRNELFFLAGTRPKYPMFFIIENGKDATYWGSWEKFRKINQNNGIADEFNKLLNKKNKDSPQEKDQEQQELSRTPTKAAKASVPSGIGPSPTSAAGTPSGGRIALTTDVWRSMNCPL